MEFRAIKTEEEYNQALKRLEMIFHAPECTKEGDEAEVLINLIEKYEDKHYPIETSDRLQIE